MLRRVDRLTACSQDVMVNNMKIADAEEGIGAFIEKRKPVWKT